MKANNPDTPVTEVDQHPSFMHVTRNRSQSNPSSSQQLLLASSVTALQLLSISRSLLRSALSASSHSGQWQNSHWPPEQQDEACRAKPILLKAHRAEPWRKQAAWHRGSCFSCTKEKKISSPTAVPEAQAYLLQQRGTGPGSYQILFYYFSDVCNSRCGADRLCWTFIWHFRISIEITVFDKKKTASAVWARTCGPGSSTVWMKRGLLIETLASLFLRQHCWAPLLNLPPSPYPILGSKSHENPQHPAKLSRANLSVQSAGVLQGPGSAWRAAQCARFGHHGASCGLPLNITQSRAEPHCLQAVPCSEPPVLQHYLVQIIGAGIHPLPEDVPLLPTEQAPERRQAVNLQAVEPGRREDVAG